jgi:hypothetical protein
MDLTRSARLSNRVKEGMMPSKSREWLETECLRLAKRLPGGREIERVTIRRLGPKGAGPNWKVADLIPQPTFAVSIKVRHALADLPGEYALADN